MYWKEADAYRRDIILSLFGFLRSEGGRRGGNGFEKKRVCPSFCCLDG